MKVFLLIVVATILSLVYGYCGTDMNNLDNIAQQNSQGKAPDGKCYSHVADYIDAVGYGGINAGGFNNAIPPAYWSYAYQFAQYLNTGNNAANLCLMNVQSSYGNNPYNAPVGSIVVVRAGTPGTANPVAGDIAVVGGNGYFWNGGAMGYGGSQNFPSSNNYVLGIYVPTTCTPNCAAAATMYQGTRNTTGAVRKPWIPYRKSVSGGTCTAPGEFCCEAPMNDPSNCPPGASTSDCAAKNSCCCY